MPAPRIAFATYLIIYHANYVLSIAICYCTLPSTADNSTVYILQWLPMANDTRLSFQLMATDSNNASSTYHPLIIFCPCEYDQICTAVDESQDGGDSRFIRQTCNCNECKFRYVYFHLLTIVCELRFSNIHDFS